MRKISCIFLSDLLVFVINTVYYYPFKMDTHHVNWVVCVCSTRTGEWWDAKLEFVSTFVSFMLCFAATLAAGWPVFLWHFFCFARSVVVARSYSQLYVSGSFATVPSMNENSSIRFGIDFLSTLCFVYLIFLRQLILFGYCLVVAAMVLLFFPIRIPADRSQCRLIGCVRNSKANANTIEMHRARLTGHVCVSWERIIVAMIFLGCSRQTNSWLAICILPPISWYLAFQAIFSHLPRMATVQRTSKNVGPFWLAYDHIDHITIYTTTLVSYETDKCTE